MHKTSCIKSFQNSFDGLRVRKNGRGEGRGVGGKLEGLCIHTLLKARGAS